MTDMSRREFFARVGLGAAATVVAGKLGMDLLTGTPAVAKKFGRETLARHISLRPNRHPALFAFTPDGTRCLIACQDTNSVAVVDRRSDALVSSISISKGTVPWSVGCMGSTGLAFVANSSWSEALYDYTVDRSTVSVVDLHTLEEVDAVVVGRGPNGVAVHDALRRVFVANTGDGTLSVLATGPGRVVDTVTLGDKPFSVALSPGASRVGVVCMGESAVYDVDPASATVRRRVTLGNATLTDPHPEYGPGDAVTLDWVDDDTAWVTLFRSAQLALVDFRRGEVTRTIDLPKSAPVVSTMIDGRYSLVAGYGIDGVVDLVAGTFVQQFEETTAASPLHQKVTSLLLEAGTMLGVPIYDITKMLWPSALDTLPDLTTTTTTTPAPQPAGTPRFPATHELWMSDSVGDEMLVVPLSVPAK